MQTSHAHRTRNRCNGTYTFHHVFAEHTPQSDFYHAAVRPLVRDVLAGHHRSVAAYGVTSSGKTFTVQGTSAHPGLVFTALEEIFQAKQNATCAYRVSMTAVEMYNEKLFDLLVAAPSVQEERMGVKRRPLELKHASLDPLPGAERWAVQGMEV